MIAAKSNRYGSRLNSIIEKMNINGGETPKLNINDILAVFTNIKGNANLYSKMIKVLELVGTKEDIQNLNSSGPIKK